MSNKKGNKKKSDQLGMPHGTAANKLRKSIMFALIAETEKDTCFQCGKRIEDVDNLSVEHKIPWLDSNNPVGLFFDLDNIAFSHLSCNASAARPWRKGKSWAKHGTDSKYHRGCRCDLCRTAHAVATKEYRQGR